MQPYFENDNATIYHGDCLEVMAEIDAPVASVVTDLSHVFPHGMPSATFRRLLRAVGDLALPMLPSGSSFVSLVRCRHLADLVESLEACPYLIKDMAVWDAGSDDSGPGVRRLHEVICHATKGEPELYVGEFGSRFQRPPPAGLLASLITATTPPGGTVLDPFMDRGDTIDAAIRLGRKAIGISYIESHCEYAAWRAKKVGSE